MRYMRTAGPIIALLAIAAASTAWALTVEEIANLKGPERQRILEEGARKEGTVNWIGGLNQDVRNEISRAFMKKYPFINAEGQRMSSRQALQRVLAENKARTFRTDLLTGSLVVELKNAKMVQAFHSPLLDSFPDEFKQREGLYASYRFAYHGIAYNTRLVSEREAPRSYEDLLDPKWKGKIVWNDSQETGGPLLITYLRRVWGEERAANYLQRLSQQGLITRPSSARNTLDLMIAGEHHVMLNAALHHVAGSRAKGAPVNASMQDPVLARNNYLLLLKTAPHPHAAMLLIDFVLDREAQEILRKQQYYPANPDVDPLEEMIPFDPLRKGLRQFTVDDEMLAEEKDKSVALFRKYFR